MRLLGKRCEYSISAALLVGSALACSGPVLSQPAYGPPVPSKNTGDVATGAGDVGPPPPGVPEPLHTAGIAAAWTHPAVRAAEGQIKAAGYDVRGAKWLRFPSLNVEALAITRGSGVASRDGTVLNATVEQPIWTGGRISASISRAKAQLLVQRHSLDEVTRDLVLRTIQAFYDIALQARRIEVLTQAREQHQELVDTIQRRVSQQISARSDLDLANGRLASVEQNLALAQAQQRAALSAFMELTGDNNPTLGNVPAYNPELHHPALEGAIEKALACDPRTARLNAQALVARADQKVARSSLLPQLLGQVSSNEVLGERVGLALRAQTGNGLSQIAAAQGAGARATATEDAIQTGQRELREALRIDFANNAAAKQRISSSSSALTSSQSVVESFKRQFIAGRRTWLDVMNSLQEWNSNRLQVVESQVTAQVTTARIKLRTCTWEPRPRFDEKMEDPTNGRG